MYYNKIKVIHERNSLVETVVIQTEDRMEKVHILCPQCGKRIFDVSPQTTGEFFIRCPRCKTIAVITKAPEPNLQRQPSAK